MAINDPPTNVAALIAKVTVSTRNIAAHREAMTEVAAKATANKSTPPKEATTP